MTEAEIELKLTSLETQLAKLRALDGVRVKQVRTIINGVAVVTVLFVIFAVGLLVLSAELDRHDLMVFAFPVMFAGVALSFLNAGLRALSVVETGLSLKAAAGVNSATPRP